MDTGLLYSMQTWQLGLMIVSLSMISGLGGLILMRQWIYRIGINEKTNETVNGLCGGVGVFFGLLVGLMAVAAWGNFDDVGKAAGKEASSVAVLYRGVTALREPYKSELQSDLRIYLHYVIEVAWPAHRKGQAPKGGAEILSHFLERLTSYDVTGYKDQALFSQVLSDYSKLIESRRSRLESINVGVPKVLWVVIICTAALSIFITYFFHIESLRAHLLLTGIFSSVLGLMIFSLVALDNPFRGEVSVETEDYRALLNTLEERALIKDSKL